MDRERTKPISALEAAIANRQLVILGDPGGGKSTFVNFLAYCLSAHALQPKAGWLSHLSKWPKQEGDLLPILVTLRDFARRYSEHLPERAEPNHLLDFIRERLHAQGLDFAFRPLQKALEEGRAFVLLDGLDEVPTLAQRVFVRDIVQAFIQRYSQNRYLVTCRVLSYQPPEKGKPDLRLNELPSYELAEFDLEKIGKFVGAWYVELARLGTVPAVDQKNLTARLEEAVSRSDLQRLARNPLLLTVMALVHTHKGRLPDARALLYEETVDMLLWRWEQIKLGGREDAPRLRQYLLEAHRTDADLKSVLWELAYNAHAASKADQDGEALADIPEFQLEKAIASLKDDDRTWAMQVLEIMKVRAGLLLERAPETFTFPHRTFQEYLAGAHLAAQSDFAQHAAELAQQGTLWRDVILYAVGRLVYVSIDKHKPLALVGELCPERSNDDETSWRLIWLAGDVMQEIGINRVRDSQLGRDLLERVQGRLKSLLEKGKLALRERARAGITLSALGDPRFNPDLWHLPNDETLGFTLIPAGKFSMGSSDKDEQADDDEKPQHEVSLPDFWMAKYPVTVAQFRAFTEATKYSFEHWQYNHVNTRPVIYVTWYEALEYAKWLDTELHQYAEKQIKTGAKNLLWQGLAENRLHIALPSEAEWEKAARGTDGRIYPWGNEFDTDKANTNESQIGDPSVVGIFPQGASLYGLLDMSGNVWEWTRSLWGKDYSKPSFKYPYNPKDNKRENLHADNSILRVLRGGSFLNRSEVARCSSRGGGLPDYRGRYFGFRVVVSRLFHHDDSGI